MDARRPRPPLRLQINSFAESDVSMTALSSICPSSGMDRGRGRKERRRGEERTILGGDGFFVLMIFERLILKLWEWRAQLGADIQAEGG